MKLDLNSNISLGAKSAAYPSKRTMNLMQHEGAAQKLPGLLLLGILALAALVLIAKFGVMDPLQRYSEQKNQLASLQQQLDACTAQLADYPAVETKYRCYSYGYLTDEEAALVDVLGAVDKTKAIIDKYGALDSITISQNAISLECSVSSLDDVSGIVADFYAEKDVAGVTVGNAADDPEKGGIRASMVVVLSKTAGDDTAKDGGQE
jgi:type II secretory pathway pseudopilin PulG